MRTTKALRNVWVICMVVLCGLGAISARAVGPEVRDSAGLFSSAAVKQADETVRKIQRELRKDLLVETFAGVPESRMSDYTRNREEFFSNFVKERAQAARLDGIYVLVMKEQPPHRIHIQVAVGQATRQRAFLNADREELVRLFQSNFREERNDEALRSGVDYVERTLRSRITSLQPASTPSTLRPSSNAPTSSSSSPWASIFVIGLFVIGGVILVGFLMRALGGGGGGGMAGSGGLGSGGGGFFSSLLGGIGGAMAGSWLYDHFFSSNAHAGDKWNSNQSDSPPSDVGGDYSSSGGDVDSGSGGDDFSSGGGDVGGGDFGDSGGGDS